jgi:glycosyltransferase involved in cell wall biosynthesis
VSGDSTGGPPTIDRLTPQRILFVVSDLFRGGAEVMLQELVRRLPPRDYSVHVLSLGSEGDIGPSLRDAGASVTSLGMRGPSDVPRAAMQASRVIAATRPDIVQGWMYHGNTAAALLAGWRSHVPVFWSIHYTLDDLSRDPRLTAALIRNGHRLARWGRVSRIIYCSKRSAEQHAALGYPPHLATIIPNAVDTTIFRPATPDERAIARSSLGIRETERTIGMFAHYRAMKDHPTVLAALSCLPATLEARLILAGRGVEPANTDLMSRIDALGVRERVILLGERSDIRSLLHAMDVQCLSSAWGEAFPVAIAEAMATGIPCVVTAVGDCAELVGNTGRVVPAGDPRALASAIQALLELPSGERQAVGAAARERVVTEFDMNRYVERHIALYREGRKLP